MLKKKSQISRTLIVLLRMIVLIVALGSTAFGAARTASVSGNWSNTATWGGAAVPVAGDNIILNSGITLTVDVNTAAVTTIVMNAPAANNAIIINSGITLNATGAITMTSPSAGTITQTLAVGDGILNAASIAIPGSATAGRYCTMSINTGTVNVTGAITTSGTAAQSRITFTGAGTINVGGNFASGTFTASTGTVNFNGTGAQTIGDLAYNNLTTSGGSGTKTWTLGAARAMTGNISVGTGTNLTTAGNNTLSVAGTTDVTGTLTLGGTSGKTFSGDVTINAGGVWNETGVATYTIAGNFTNNATTFTANTGVHTFSGTTKTIGGTTANVIPSATFTGNYTNSGTLTCATALTVTGAAVVLINNGTITATTALSGTGALTNPATYTLNIGGTCSITTLTNAGTAAITGAGAISTALTNFTNTGTLNLGGSGTITGITNGTGGIVNLTNSGTITSFNNSTATSILNISDLTVPTITTLTVSAAGNTVNYSGAGDQTVIDVAYSNLTTSGSGTKTWTEGAARIMTGNLTVGDGTTLSVAGAYALTVSGTTAIGNGTSGTLSITNATGTKTFTGAVTINGGGAITESAAAQLAFGSDVTIYGTLTENGTAVVGIAGSLINNGTYTASTGIHTFSGATKTIGGTTANVIPSATFTGNYTNSGTLTCATALTVTGAAVVLTNSGTMTATTALSGTGALTNSATGTLNIGGTSAITTLTVNTVGNTVNFTGAGAQTIPGLTYYDLGFSGAGTKTIAAGTTITVGRNWAVGSTTTMTTTANAIVTGSITGTGAITMGSGTITVGGDFTNSGTFTQGTSTVNYNGSSVDQIVCGGITYYNLQISNGGSKLLQVGNVTVSNILTLSSGVFKIGDFNLILSNTGTNAIAGSPFSISNMIQTGGIGYVQKAGVANGTGINIIYPIGSGGYYNPLDLTSGFATSGGPGNLQIRATTANQGANALSKYWTIAVNAYTGTITTNLRFTYDNAEVRGAQSQYDTWYNGGSWVSAPGTHTALGANPFGSNVTGVTAASISGKWTAGSLAPSTSISYYSYQSGRWTDATSWTTDHSGTFLINSGVPGASDSVTILNGRTITIIANNQQANTLTINQGGILDLGSTTGHNFGTITGQGKIMLSSNNLPTGTYTSFVASNGGTIEYYNLNNVSISITQLTYNNLIISNYTTNANSAFINNSANPTTYIINGNVSLKNYSSGSQTVSFGNPTASDNLINMTIFGNLSVDAQCNINVNNFASSHAIPNPSDEGATAYPIHTLNLYGNFTNNGTVRFTGLPSPVAPAYYLLTTTASGGINYGDVQVIFLGATNNTVTCNGTTDFFRFIVAKGTDKTYTLEVNSSNVNNFALYAPNNQGNSTFDGGAVNGYGYGAYYKALFIHYGTLKLNGNISIPSLTEGGQDFNLVPTAGLWINGANVSTTISGVNGTGYQAATLYGYLRVSAGQFSTGDAAGIVLGTLGAPTILVEGTGTLDVSQAWTTTGASNQMSYIQTGGTANFRLQGENHAGPMLGLSNINSSFTVSGGTINFVNNTFIDATTDFQVLDIESQVGNYNVTGGNINVNLPSSATVYTANSTVPFYNLNISNRTGTGTTTVQWNNTITTLSVLHDLAIGGNSVLNLNTSSINLNVGHDLTVSSGGTYTPSTVSTTTFNGTGAQAFNNVGTITGGLNNLTITNSSLTSIINNNVIVNGALTIDQNSVLNDSGKTVTVSGNIINSGTHISRVNTGTIILTGTAAQTLNGNGTGIFNNLTLNKTGGSVASTANMTVTGNLRLAGGTAGLWNILNIGSNNLSLGANAMVYSDLTTGTTFNNNRMIQTSGLVSDGGVSKTFSNTNAFNFTFGFYNTSNTTYYYMPDSIQFNIAPTTYGTVTTRPVNARHPLAQGSNNALTCYWKTTSTGFTGVTKVVNNYYYDYAASNHFVAGTEANYVPAVYSNASWITASRGVNPAANRVSDTTNNADGEYTAGDPASAFGSIQTLYSIADGNWNVSGTWSTTRGGSTSGVIPTASSVVYICDGHKVTTTVAASSSNLIIEPGSTLDLQNIIGHNFGTIVNNAVTGSGTLRIASNNYFPTGDWGSFLGTIGGTVEYYQLSAGTVSLPTTYTLPAGGSVNIAGYSNLITSPYSGSNIILPNTNLMVYNNFTIGYSTGAGTSNCITQINAGAASTTFEVKGNININPYGVLQYMNNVAQNVIADNDVNIASNGVLKVRNGGNPSLANTLTIFGNVVNNDSLDLDSNYPTNDNFHCSLIFIGSSSKYLTNTTTPLLTRLYSIAVNKGTSRDSVLNVNIDPTGFQMGGGGLTLQNGTFRLTTSVTMPLSTSSFTIPSTACLSANGGTFNIATVTTAAADLILNGRLEVLTGNVNVGPAIGSASTYAFNIVYASAGNPEIKVLGGALNVFSQIRRGTITSTGSLNYTQTGGTVTIGCKNPNTSRAALEVLNDGVFTMSGGKLIIANHITAAVPYDLYLDPSVENVTGGTIQFGLSAAVTTSNIFYFQSSCSIGNITLESTSNSSAIQQTYELTLLGNLTIGGTSSYYNTNGLDVTIGGNFTNNNTTAASNGLNVGGYRTQVLTQSTAFVGSTNQIITGTAANRTNFANLEIATAQNDTSYLTTNVCNITVNGDLTLTSGTLNDGGNIIYLLNNVDNNAVHYSPNSTSGGMVFNGTVNQGITGNETGVFGNIEINDGSKIVNMTDNSTIAGQLKFTNGYLYIDDYALTLGQNAAIAGTKDASHLILLNGVISDRGVTKIFPTGPSISPFTFPIGANGKYTPCTYNFSSNGNPSGGTIKVVPVDDLHPSINPASYTNYLYYYWYVVTTGFSSSPYTITHTYTFIPTDVEGSPANIERCDNSTSAWSNVTPGTITSPTFSFTSSSLLDGSYTIGDQFHALPLITSVKSGNWNDPLVWDLGIVPNGNPVVIRSTDSVALNVNSAKTSSVIVNGVLDAENTTFHNIGLVSGTGKIKVLNTNSGMFVFPGGSFDGFFTNPASTLEFYGNTNGTMPLNPGNNNKPYQNIIISGTGIKYISSVDTKIDGNLTISSNSKLDNTLYNKDITILGNWIDNNTSGGFNDGTGTVRFSGTTAQNIVTGNGSATETFYNLEINNTAGVTINTGNVDVNNQLILTSGNITTSGTNNLTLNNINSNVVVGGGVNSFVNGPLRKKMTSGSSFQFPVGDAVSSGRNRFGYVTVSCTSTTGTQIWIAQFFDKNPTSAGYDITQMVSPLQSIVNNEYWNINCPSGGSANVVLSWDQYTGMSSSAPTRALTRVAEWAASWNSIGQVVTDNGQISGTVATSTPVSLESHFFTIGSTSIITPLLITSIANGDWNSGSTWNYRVPTSIDTVHISNSFAVTLNTNVTITKLIVDNGGSFDNSNSFSVINDLYIGSGSNLKIESGASISAGKIILDDGANYINLSSSAPILQVNRTITGNEGWRMLAAPDNVTVGSMFASPFVTQGFTGSSYPSLQPNLMWWDETSQGTSLQAWRQPSNSTDTVKLGKGYMYYVFNGALRPDVASNYSDVLPLKMTATGTENLLKPAAFDFSVTATARSATSHDTTYVDTNAVDYGWNLVGNPTPSTINWNALSGWTKTNMDGTIYIWDPATSSYKSWNGTTGNLGSGLIAPFQAFWVKANTTGPSLKCDNGVKTTGGSFLGKVAAGKSNLASVSSDSAVKKISSIAKSTSLVRKISGMKDTSDVDPIAVLELELSANGQRTQAYLMFSHSGKLTYDPYDAFSLVPLSDNYLILYSVAGTGQPAMQIQNLPDIGYTQPIAFPLYVGGTVGNQPLSGSFTLSWKLDGQLAAGWNIMLMDDAVGSAISMIEAGQLTFQYTTPADLISSSSGLLQKESSESSNRRSLHSLPRPVVQTVPTVKLAKGSASASRFRLVVSTNNDLNGYLPTTPQLAQNYPNPFNPTTNITFSIPSQTRVAIRIFNILGQQVATVTDQEYSAGNHLVVWNASNVASGVYFCRMTAAEKTQTKKMIVLR